MKDFMFVLFLLVFKYIEWRWNLDLIDLFIHVWKLIEHRF
jgi:hypothetical protein